MKRISAAALVLFASLFVSPATWSAEPDETPPRTCGPLPEPPIRGKAWAVDGGALSFVASSGRRLYVRLWGIETPPLRDATTRIERVPGVQARFALDERLRQAGRDVSCSPVAWDQACRLVATCEAAGNDLGIRLLVEGYALLRTHQAVGKDALDLGRHYAESEERARDRRNGLWLNWLGPKMP
ncbi:MAG TPA: thermonuclease family protein [Vineibacter sp.]|nr:thermonuclease family protein [Vineibacter sp.]